LIATSHARSGQKQKETMAEEGDVKNAGLETDGEMDG
jgi:hypothetical protein